MKHPALYLTIAALVCGAQASAAETLTMRPLFNGKDLTGWKGEGYIIEDGAITCTPQGRNLITEETFANFVFDFEFKLSPGANNGLGIHYPGTGDAAYTGMEIQVLDSTHPKYKDLKDYQFHGGLYTMAPAIQGMLKSADPIKQPIPIFGSPLNVEKKEGYTPEYFLKPVGEWNQQRVTVMGPVIKVELNGEIILRANLDQMALKFPAHQGAKRRSGHIGWLGHGDKVSYRKIHIAELPPVANEEGVKSNGFSKIFDGSSFKGWKTAPDMNNWKAILGVLKHNGKSGTINDLWTEKSYQDFTLVCDWRWSGRGPTKSQPNVMPDGTENGRVEIEELDSGIYLRGNTKSQVNLWNWPIGSGEVYGYRTDGKMSAEVKAGVTPKAKADKPLGEWNRTMITLKGDRLTVTLNGELVINNAQLPGIPATGPIGLQHHGGAIDFANIWVKEL
jgi:hypothetical protein